ncbi:MAG: SufD family Fe-S cluster assembly protein [Candidatus Hydrogenedentes bacterium]|nr:SufD family Fe-S cluster assembly protein [Candidatus Hydrogenedentota bacterium]
MSNGVLQSDSRKRLLPIEVPYKYSENKSLPDWFRKIIKDGLSAIEELPIPDSKTEGWRETNVSLFFNNRLKWQHLYFCQDIGGVKIPLIFSDNFPPNVIYFNRRVNKDGAIELEKKGVSIYTLSQRNFGEDSFLKTLLISEKESRHIFESVSRAFLFDGLVIEVPDNLVVEDPINIYFPVPEIKNHVIDTPWLFLMVGSNSQVSISVHYLDEREDVSNPIWVNASEIISLSHNAHLKFLSSISGSSSTYRYMSTAIQLRRDSSVSYNSLMMSGKFVRSELNLELRGENILSLINGVSLNESNNHSETQQLIEHLQSNCMSRINWRGIGKDESKTLYRGKIYIAPNAQKSDSIQLFKGLSLSDKAVVDAKPQLEIYADDVRCTHGATVGPPPQDLLFYFRARGIDAKKAKNLLLSAFVRQILAEIPFRNVENLIKRYLEVLYD